MIWYTAGQGMNAVEYRLGAAVALLWVACLPLFGIGYGIAFAGRMLSAWVRREKHRRRNERRQKERESALQNTPSLSNLKSEITEARVAGEWARAHSSAEGRVGFGLLLLKVEEAVDNSIIMGADRFGNHVIVGRMPGLKGWLEEHCPHISYKTAMRYKTLTKKTLKSPEPQ